jgi:CRISPR/Cas system-associated endonuclease/helicase Cas3
MRQYRFWKAIRKYVLTLHTNTHIIVFMQMRNDETKSNFVKMTVTLPREVARKLQHTNNKSRYVAEAIVEKSKRERRVQVLKELEQLPPAFPKIKDSSRYIRQMRADDEERAERLGL